MWRCALLAVLVLAPCAVLQAEEPEQGDGPRPEPTFQERVNAAIDRGVAWLQERQQKDGSWGPCMSTGIAYDGSTIDPKCHETGPTSFALYTLLSCGIPRRDAGVKKGVKWLKRMEKTDHEYTSYEISSIVLMLTAMYDTGEAVRTARTPEHKPRSSPFRTSDWKWLHAHVQRLVGPDGFKRRYHGWGYWDRGTYEDLSATQFALLALRAAARAGYPVKATCPRVWTDSLNTTRSFQAKGGAMRYVPDEHPTAGMTAAGLANYLICRERLELEEDEVPEWVDPAIDEAYALLGRVYKPTYNHIVGENTGDGYHYCYLYAVERVGALGGKHLLGTTPWYPSGATWLVAMQKENGAWRDESGMGPPDVLGTCFALLFLKKATPPAVITPPSD